MPSDNTQKPTTNAQVVPTMDDVPPMINSDQSTVISDQSSPTTSHQPPVADSGSAAPSDDIVMPPIITAPTPKKKFAGGRIIATILGLFLLVGGVGAGTYLVQQNQDIREKAGACGGMCGGGRQCAGDLDGDGDGDCVPRGSTDEQVANNEVEIIEVDSNGDGSVNGNVEVPGQWQDPDGDGAYNPNENGGCSSGDYHCGGSGANYDFCLQASEGKTCNEAAGDLGYVVPIGCSNPLHVEGVGDGNNTTWTPGEFVCPPTILENTVIYLCTRAQYEAAGGICDSRTLGRRILNHIPGSFCGIIQVDENTSGGNHQSFESSSGCGGDEPPVDNPTTPPTTPPITAQCQNLKAYPMTGNNEVPLTQAQLSTLKSGDQFNLCVQGIKTGGSFDKVRFTINGVLQPEQNMTDRIGTTTEGRFCTLYTIPQTLPTNRTFNFNAEMHHVTLGWK